MSCGPQEIHGRKTLANLVMEHRYANQLKQKGICSPALLA
jgi:hypothetical protein